MRTDRGVDGQVDRRRKRDERCPSNVVCEDLGIGVERISDRR